MAGGTRAAGKAAARVAAGGGPEDPLADIAAAAALARERAEAKREKAARERARERGAGPEPSRTSDARGNATFRGEGGRSSRRSSGRRGGVPRSVAWAWSGNRRVLTAQYVLVIVIVGLGALLSGDDDKDDVVLKALIKSSALSLLFFLLALMTAGSKGSAKAATAFGSLITATYVFTSKDMHRILSWIGSFFGREHHATAAPEGAAGTGAGEVAGDLAGEAARRLLEGGIPKMPKGSEQLVDTGDLS